MPLKQSIGNVLREIRVEKGLSLSDISESTGRSRGNLSDMETQGIGLTIEMVESICDALGVKVSTVVRRAEK